MPAHSHARPALAVLAACGLALPALAFATPVPSVDEVRQSITVNFADLDLGTARGQSQLRHRIQIAAAEVCGQDHGMRPLAQEVMVRQCYEQAMSRARTDLAQAMTQRHLAVR